jgi:hypothetical protein
MAESEQIMPEHSTIWAAFSLYITRLAPLLGTNNKNPQTVGDTMERTRAYRKSFALVDRVDFTEVRSRCQA